MTDWASDGIPERIREQAYDWLTAHLSGTHYDELEFARWLNADPRHRTAYQRVSGVMDESAGLDKMSAGQSHRLGKAPFLMRRSTQVGLAACVAVIFAGALGLAVLQFGPAHGLLSAAEARTYETRTGEIKTIRLDDGSVVTLDTQTALQVPVGADVRKARLIKGRARFFVATARKPFVVTLSTGELRSVGSTFDVSLLSADAEVLSIKGTVDLHENSTGQAESFTLDHGKAAQLIPQPEAQDARVLEPQWISGMLAFDRLPLGEAIAAINRYNTVQIRTDTPAIGAHKVSGTFAAQQPGAFAKAVATMYNLSIKTGPATITLTEPAR